MKLGENKYGVLHLPLVLYSAKHMYRFASNGYIHPNQYYLSVYEYT